MARVQRRGKLKLLRVHDVGTGYGPKTDHIDVEVVVHMARVKGAFGFRLRNDKNRPAHQGMLDLLRDSFERNIPVTIEYDIKDGKDNGVIMRAWLSK